MSVRNSPLFSIGTLVTNAAQYAEMKESFVEHGFRPGSAEYLTIDNSQGNSRSAYQGLADLLDRAQGEYVLLCHQDLLLISDGYAELESRLRALDDLHPDWAVAGNSGMTADGEHPLHISDPHADDQFRGPLPAQVRSLDENFLIVRRSSGIRPSPELSGFHFYGTDLCLQAERAGRSAWVIDFHLRHLSAGKVDPTFHAGKTSFERHWGARLNEPQLIRTTCTALVLGTGPKAFWLRLVRSAGEVLWLLRFRLNHKWGRLTASR